MKCRKNRSLLSVEVISIKASAFFYELKSVFEFRTFRFCTFNTLEYLDEIFFLFLLLFRNKLAAQWVYVYLIPLDRIWTLLISRNIVKCLLVPTVSDDFSLAMKQMFCCNVMLWGLLQYLHHKFCSANAVWVSASWTYFKVSTISLDNYFQLSTIKVQSKTYKELDIVL